MLFAIIAHFKPGVDTEPGALQDAFNEHLKQPLKHIRLAGSLRDKDGKRTGRMIMIEGAGVADAHDYIEHSPYFRAGLYDRVEICEYSVEAGHLA